MVGQTTDNMYIGGWTHTQPFWKDRQDLWGNQNSQSNGDALRKELGTSERYACVCACAYAYKRDFVLIWVFPEHGTLIL